MGTESELKNHAKRLTEDIGWQHYSAIGLSAWAAVYPMYLVLIQGSSVQTYDTYQVWVPFGEAVLSGQSPYLVTSTIDLKPPLLEFLFIGVAATPKINFALLALMVASLPLAVYTSYLVAAKYTTETAALTAPIVALSLIQYADWAFNNEMLVAPLVGLFLLSADARRSGIVAGLATGFTQYAVVLIPIAAYQHKPPGRIFSHRALFWSLALFCGQFALLGVVWGVDSMVAGVWYTFGTAGQYISGTGAVGDIPMIGGSIFESPNAWALWVVEQFRAIGLQLTLAVVGTLALLHTLYHDFDQETAIFTLTSLALVSTFFVATAVDYFIMLAVPIGVLSSVAVRLLTTPILEATYVETLTSS